MKFFHVYNEDFFEGLIKNNLINEDTGFKIQNVYRMPDERHFNTLAKKDGFLYNMIKENNYPFYIDRICGGTHYYKFEFDKQLIADYVDLLGDWFLGFQHHESASNRRLADWRDILKAMNGDRGPYDVEVLKEKFLTDGTGVISGVGGKRVSLLRQDGPEVYAKLRYAETEDELMDEFIDMFKRKMDDVDGYTFPCDSFFLLTKLQDELGMRTFMPEVGWQIAQMRIAVALARGIAEPKGKLWGLYYEPWIAHSPSFYSLPKYTTEYETEWFHTPERALKSILRSKATSGSSRRLQKRIYYYTLMCGANYLSEEWGLNASYYDKKSFELSPYGLVKKEFIDFAIGYRNIKAKIPFAIVLPLSYKCVQIPEPEPFETYRFGEHRASYMGCDIDDARKEYIGHIEDVLKFFYERCGEEYGNEGHVMTNSRFGDLFDIIYEDATDENLAKYAALVDATPDGTFAAKKGNTHKVLKSDDFDKLAFSIRKLTDETLDCQVDSLHWILSTDEKGKRYVSIFNNEGNLREEETGDTLIKEAEARVKVSFKEATDLKVIKAETEDVTVEKADDKTYFVTIPPAGFVIFEY